MNVFLCRFFDLSYFFLSANVIKNTFPLRTTHSGTRLSSVFFRRFWTVSRVTGVLRFGRASAVVTP
ncbi:MAG: hypothetical protein ACOX5Z_06905 [Desulfobulbus sp.]|jgi:hypothetical protein